jgi:outer membrane protein
MASAFRKPVLSLCAALVSLSPLAFSQSRIGTMDAQKSVMDTAEFKTASVDMLTRYKARQAQLEQMRKDVKNLTAGGVATLGDDAAKRSQIDLKQHQIEQAERKLRTDRERERNEILQRGRARMIEVVRRIMDEKGLDGVIDITSAVLFKPGLDITEEATAAYDKAHPVK